MTTQAIFNQKCCQTAAAPTLLEGLLLQPVHDASGKCHVEPLGGGRLGHLTSADSRIRWNKLLLQLMQKALKE